MSSGDPEIKDEKKSKKEKKPKKVKKAKKEKKSKKEKKKDIIIPVENDGAESGSDSDSDDGLFNMASKWANTKENEDHSIPTSSKNESNKIQTIHQPTKNANPYVTPYNPTGISLLSPSPRERSRRQSSPFSLHITNLPYTASKEEIEKAFTDKGCTVSSIRLVYNHHISRSDYNSKSRDNAPKSSNGFTGVAFVDFDDKKSYELGLGMDKMNWEETEGGKGGDKKRTGWRRRRLNVRPTKTKEQLAEIVERTKEKMGSQREEYHKARNERIEREEKDNQNHDSNSSNDDKKEQSSKLTSDKKKEDGNEGKKRKQKSAKDDDKSNPDKKKRKREKGGEMKKLTKKERARKDAYSLSEGKIVCFAFIAPR